MDKANLNLRLRSRYEPFPQICGMLVMAIGAAALAGWLTGSGTLKGIGANVQHENEIDVLVGDDNSRLSEPELYL